MAEINKQHNYYCARGGHSVEKQSNWIPSYASIERASARLLCLEQRVTLDDPKKSHAELCRLLSVCTSIVQLLDV